MSSSPLRLALLLALAATPVAQTTWVVDINGGPGSHFTTVGAALAVVVDGDTVLVRTGSYVEFGLRTDKGIRLVCDPGTSLGFLGFSISGVRLGQTMTMRGFSFQPAGILTLTNNQGQVHVEDVDLSPSPTADGGWLFVDNSLQVSLTQVNVKGYQANLVSGSRASLVNCTFGNVQRGGFASPALTLESSTVSIVGGSITGGLGFSTTPESGMQVTGGTTILAGNTTTISAGLKFGSTAPVPAIVNAGGTIEWEPAVTLISRNGAPPISGGTVIQRRIPSVVADSLANGATWTLDTHAPQGSAACLITSLPVVATPTPFGELWFSPTANLVLACSTVGASEVWTLQIPLQPGLPRGAPLVVQAAVATGGILLLSQPVISLVE